MKHSPNKLEIILSGVVVFVSMSLTGIILPSLISTDKLPLFAIIALFIILFLIFVVGIQSVFNIFYLRWQRKKRNGKKKIK